MQTPEMAWKCGYADSSLAENFSAVIINRQLKNARTWHFYSVNLYIHEGRRVEAFRKPRIQDL